MSFPISMNSPIRHSGTLPARADVVVVGGGIIGVMTAWALADMGISVVVCEKGRIAGEQSSRNWGWIRQQGRDPAEAPIVQESLAVWKSLSASLGEGLGFRQNGVLYLANHEKELGNYDAWLASVAGIGLDSRMLSRKELAAMIPDAKADWKGALWTASDARAEPWVALPLIAAAAAEKPGLTIRESCAVRCLDLQGGEVTGVYTEHGRIACDQVVVAGGAWSRFLLAAHGVKIPQLAVLASVAATESLPQVFAGSAADSRFAFSRRADGGYTIAPCDHHDFMIGPNAFRDFTTYLPVLGRTFADTGFRLAAPRGYPDAWGTPRRLEADRETPFERMRVLNPTPNARVLDGVASHFGKAFPEIGKPKLVKSWAGMIDTMPDVVPVIDHAPIPGLVIATGMCGHGFGIGPGMGQVVARLVAGRPTGHDLSRFRLSRFSDGSKMVPGPSV